GGRSSRRFGGARTMSWAVLLTLPVCVPLTIFHLQKSSGGLGHVTTDVWFSLIYLALISQSLGMFLWFKVLGKGPMEKLSLAQLLQPFFTLLAAIILLNEEVSASTWLIAALVAICVLGANKGRQ